MEAKWNIFTRWLQLFRFPPLNEIEVSGCCYSSLDALNPTASAPSTASRISSRARWIQIPIEKSIGPFEKSRNQPIVESWNWTSIENVPTSFDDGIDRNIAELESLPRREEEQGRWHLTPFKSRALISAQYDGNKDLLRSFRTHFNSATSQSTEARSFIESNRSTAID